MNGKQWTDEQINLLMELYPSDIEMSEMCERIGRKKESLYSKAQQLGLSRPESTLKKYWFTHEQTPSQIACRFKKGQTPPNKGKKMTSEQYEKCAPTMFKKGNKPINHREVGSERVTKDGYVEIKVSEPNKWKLKHRVIWEQVNGPIPKGYNIQFRNGNSQDIRIENLYIISKEDQLRNENSLYSRYPEELLKVIRLKAALKHTITSRTKKKKDEQ